MNFNRKALEDIQKDRLDLAEKKNNDYSSVVDVIGTTGLNGLATRIFDKAARLLSLVTSGKREISDESIVDTLKDLGNYADFGVSISNGTWGKHELEIYTEKMKSAIQKAQDNQIFPVNDGLLPTSINTEVRFSEKHLITE